MKTIPRLLHLPPNKSFFLFGPRNTGKSTLVEELYDSSTTFFINLTPSDISTFRRLTQDMAHCEAICLCNEKYPKTIENISILPWLDGIKRYFIK